MLVSSELMLAGARVFVTDVMCAPSTIHLLSVKSQITNAGVGVAAQNIYCEPKGAFTGETR